MHVRETRKPRLYRSPRVPPRPLLWFHLMMTLVVALAFACVPALADERDGAEDPEPEGLMLREGDRWVATLAMDTTVDMQVRGLLAEVSVRQTYRNDSSQWREGRYLLPLPEDAAVGALTLRIGKRLIEGEIREKEKAKAIYAAAAANGQRASLVEQNRPNLFQTAVANIGPGEEIEIEVRYWQPVAYRDGTFSLNLPLTLTPRYTPAASSAQALREGHSAAQALPAVDSAVIAGSALPPSVVLTAEIEPGLPLATLTSPTHRVTVMAEGSTYRVTLSNFAEATDRDFVLQWQPVPSKAPRSAVFTDRIGGENFALVMLVPPTLAAVPLPRELILVIDNSGSMSGTSMEQAIEAADRALARLRPGDRFNVVRFDDTFDLLYPEAVPAQPGNVARARSFVRSLTADGGTEMLPALRAALAGAAPAGYLRQVVLATDAAVGNEDELLALIEAERGEARLFPVGIGSAPNGHFLRKAAETGRGTQTVIRNVEEVTEAMDRLLAKLDRPAMRDIQLDWPGVAEMYPARVPDLYEGEALQVVARLDQLQDAVTVRGLRPQPWVRRVPLGGMNTTPSPGIGRLWARARINALEDDLRRGGDSDSLKPMIVDVALRHGLVSAYTSLVAVDRTPVRPKDQGLGSTQMMNSVPDGSLEFAQGSTGWLRELLLALVLALSAFFLLRARG
ncbi:MAG: marine proteobacterial sortase target protein [Arenimonas sp.]|uniref:marine proteobacterial sortase target protein n=1 Tax=Arenimonas sp. TaxID=1872635 RepID=UPI0025BA8224|nr:marine proteobacterial sortase target protein [Arenimonas sp.]MBW8368689.1 marine proteobacterial sortase target protein [Arenimonas sp.]